MSAVSVYHLHAVPEETRRGRLLSWNLELLPVGSHHVGGGNQTRVLWKNSQRS